MRGFYFLDNIFLLCRKSILHLVLSAHHIYQHISYIFFFSGLQIVTMGKDKSEKKDKKEKKEKKRSETDGVHKSSKKEKKEKKLSEVAEKELTAQVLEGLEKKDAVVEEVVAVNGEAAEAPIGALVPFANPLAEDKTAKKVFKTVKKGWFFSSIFFFSRIDE